MAGKSEKRAAVEAVAAYHEAQLAALLEHVAQAVDRFRAGELDAFEVDDIIFQYKRAAKELWKFCNLGDAVSTARLITDPPEGLAAPEGWWEEGAPKRR